ncbi:MAG TPA: hypothetical protein PKC12_00950 [Thiobacillaceae bacterium]|nr:hypothetical protein [Thiobacillaceae bacterium]
MTSLIHVLWPSFLAALAAEVVFAALVDPTQLSYRGEALIEDRVAAYTIAFFAFWLIGMLSSALTCYFQRSAGEING